MKYIKSFKIFESDEIEDEESNISCDYLLSYVLEYLESQLINFDISSSGPFQIPFHNRPFDYTTLISGSNDMIVSIRYDNKQVFKGIDYEENLIPLVRKQLSRLRINLNSLVHKLSIIFDISNKESKDRLEEFEVIKDYQIDYISLESLYDFYKKEFNKEQFEKHWDPKK